jgi:hypothetical protein
MPVNWKNLGERAKVAADKAKDVVEKRGGTEALKRDADELKKIAKGEGSIKEKAQKAATALKEPAAGEAKPEADAGESDPGAPEAPTAPPPKQASPGAKKAGAGKAASAGEKAVADKKASAGKAANQPAGKPKQTR